MQLYGSTDGASRIGNLVVLRNAFAHSAERVAGLHSDKQKKTLRALERSKWVEEDIGYFLPSKKGLESALRIVESEVSSLRKRAIAWDDKHRGNVKDGA